MLPIRGRAWVGLLTVCACVGAACSSSSTDGDINASNNPDGGTPDDGPVTTPGSDGGGVDAASDAASDDAGGASSTEDAGDVGDGEVSSKDYEVTTYAGSTAGVSGAKDSDNPLEATFNTPFGIALGRGADGTPDGSLYVADTRNHKIRKIDPNGKVSTYAGTGVASPITPIITYVDGNCAAATFNMPHDIAVDKKGNLYVAGGENAAIRMITPPFSCQVSTLAGGTYGDTDATGKAAAFRFPTGLALNAVDTVLYVADTVNNKIRQVSLDNNTYGKVTTVAGSGENNADHLNGVVSLAKFMRPRHIAVDAKIGSLYVTEQSDIRKITTDGWVSTLAGPETGAYGTLIDGTGVDARLGYPWGVAFDADGNLIVADEDNNAIRRVTPDGKVITIAGKRNDSSDIGEVGRADGQGDQATFNGPTGVAVDVKTGVIYVADSYNHSIRKITRKTK